MIMVLGGRGARATLRAAVDAVKIRLYAAAAIFNSDWTTVHNRDLHATLSHYFNRFWMGHLLSSSHQVL